MNKKLLVLSASILVLTACGGGETTPSNSESLTSTSTTTSSTPTVEYISQTALDSLSGTLKAVGTYTVTDLTESDYTFSSEITTIFGGDYYYTLDVNEFEEYELYTKNVDGNVAIVTLTENNEVEAIVYEDEDGTIAWEDMCGNPLTDLQASDFVKQSDGTFLASDATDRSNLALVAYGYYREMSEVKLTVNDNKVTGISFTSSLYTDGFGSTMQDSGFVTISEHGSAVVPTIEPKPEVSAHQDLAAALAAMADTTNFQASFEEEEIDVDLGIPTGEKINWVDYYTDTAYYSSYQYDISEDDNPIYVTQGYFEVDSLGVFAFSKDANDALKVESNYPSNSISDLLDGRFEGFSVALFESKGNGVFTAYDDTVSIVAPYVVLDSEVSSSVVELSLKVVEQKIVEISYVYVYEFFGFVLGEYQVIMTIDEVGTTVIPFDLSAIISEVTTLSSIDDSFLGNWKNDNHSLKITKTGILFDNSEVLNIAYSSDTLTFVVEDITYSVTVDELTGELVVVPSEGETFRLSLPSIVAMPEEAKEAVLSTLGVELKLPGVSNGEYSVESGTDGDGLPLVVITIANADIEDYVNILQEAGYEVDDTYLSSDGLYVVNDPEMLLWIQLYEGESGGIELYIWNY